LTTLFFEMTFARTGAVQQMLGYQFLRLCDAQLPQGHSRPKQLTDVRYRQLGQFIHLEQLWHLWVGGIMGLSLEACLGDEPRCHDRECQVVLPSPVLERLTLIPPQLRPGILDRAFHEVALGFHVGQGFQGGVRRRIAEGSIAFGIWDPNSGDYLQPAGHLPIDDAGRVRIDSLDLVFRNE